MKSVGIVVATYKPNMTYLEEQFKSLEEQTYPNYHIYIRDDSADDDYFKQIATLATTIFTRPFTIVQNDVNMGSTKTFELLTSDCQQEYIAYCDQDDRWHHQKIEKLVYKLEQEKALLVYSDLAIIDENGQFVSSSFATVNKRIYHVYGDNTFSFFIRRNCMPGCSMLMLTEIAKKAMPFYEEYVHDHWLALVAASMGRIAFIKELLIDYRLHQHNQIGKAILKGIDTVDDYIPLKLVPEQDKFRALALRFGKTYQKEIDKELSFVGQRIQAFQTRKFKDIWSLTKYLKEDKTLVLFEIALTILPKYLGNKMIRRIKSGG
ncbi:glycosyltransferase [Carnobacteriaceae bacterium zg-ZUI78]|uniref:glycosyltransferase n=1 Tax=Granulicatella sp. zg-84 TaxID=2678503 RepID=UPI0013BEEEA6|nr:glycosyltransferase [Granulicatella sp. zg-84]MBS4750889.1 glycosyltransferase [Carnobacteriaceae bacterium zg-ZUI78]NEW65544.1 glycosyltransferase [Granulicatella sp. zg-84]QMI85574.1 glycosyltransferase [Carnobacteriaceae bacterium zg-84]